MYLTRQRRILIVTFVGAGLAAVLADHFIKPNVSRRLGI